ncbi:hypothetical protein M5689_013543 [Euphorbia peplus]|nr:hypothetical protein M5689_013543 [Euphorbia peplus]
MSGIVEVCVREISKLTEKVRPLILVSSKGKARTVGSVEGEAQMEKSNNLLMNDTDSMSEATVCMLMDRFVPW